MTINKSFLRIWDWIKRVDAWWFSWGSPLTLVTLRISVGFLAVANLLLLSAIFPEFFFQNGLTPDWAAETWSNGTMINLLRGSTSERTYWVFLWITTGAALCMTVGLSTRVATVVTTLGTMTLQARNPFVIHGGDTLLRLVLIYLCFARTDALWSVDNLIRRRRNSDWVPPARVPLWPQKLIMFQMAVMYLATVFEKLLTIPWRDGSAVYYVSRLTAYQRFPLPEILSQPPVTTLMTYGTLIVETLLGLAAFYPHLRKYAITYGVILHLGITFSMNIPIFGELTLVLYLSYFSGEELATLGREIKGYGAAIGRVVRRLASGRMPTGPQPT
jgi:hypothetical protein